MKLIVEGLRCFRERRETEILPITLLVGENSTGKSTFLAALSAVHDPEFPFRASFNRPPYSLGSFDSTASVGSDSFVLGYLEESGASGGRRLEAEFIPREGQTVLRDLVVEGRDRHTKLEFVARSPRSYDVTLELPAKSRTKEVLKGQLTIEEDLGAPPASYVPFLVFDAIVRESRHAGGKQDPQRLLDQLMRLLQPPGSPTISSAPIRTRPQRMYEQLADQASPEGGHIPYLLYQRLGSKAQDDVEAKKALLQFGRSTGLYDDVKPRRLGEKPGDPFQILVNASGVDTTIMDVGYGVSQVLPVLTESLTAKAGSRLLLQQPEVHLHPRGQAELATFFVDLWTTSQKEFVVETHSDYLLDRLRLEVRRGRCQPDDVLILYFVKGEGGSKIHEIRLDEMGNFVDPPLGFRGFFLKEQFEMLGYSEADASPEVLPA